MGISLFLSLFSSQIYENRSYPLGLISKISLLKELALLQKFEACTGPYPNRIKLLIQV